MSGSRRILLLVEDPKLLFLDCKEEDSKYINSYCSLLKVLCKSFLNCYEYNMDGVFYAVVSPNQKRTCEWQKTTNLDLIRTLQEECTNRLSNTNINNEQSTNYINYRDIYNTLIKLKSEIGTTDVVDIVWVIPDLEIKSDYRMAVPADMCTASLLFSPLNELVEQKSLNQLSLLSTCNSNDILIWAKLLYASVYWVSPEAFPPLFPPTLNSSLSYYPAQKSSLIFETTSSSQPKAETKKIPRLPLIEYDLVFEVSPTEIEIVFTRLIASRIQGRYCLEWKMHNGSFQSYFNPNKDSISVLHKYYVSMIQVDEAPFDIDDSQPIQLLCQFHPLELIRILHVFLDQSYHYSLIFPHPIQNALKPLSSSHPIQYYGCNVMIQMKRKQTSFSSMLTNISFQQKPKEKSTTGLLMMTSTSAELYIITPYLKNDQSTILTYILKNASNRPQYTIIFDNDIPSQLGTVSLTNEDSTMSLLLKMPSSIPPISRDLTLFCNRNPKEVCYEQEKEILNRISNLTIHESDVWCNHLFKPTSKKTKKIKKIKHQKTTDPSLIHSNRHIETVSELTRSFLNSGEPAVDMNIFEFKLLSLPDLPDTWKSLSTHYEEQAKQLQSMSIDDDISLYAAFGEDFWNSTNTTEEARIVNMSQRVTEYSSLCFLGFTRAKSRRQNSQAILESNYASLDRVISETIPYYVPSSYKDSSIYERIIELSTLLCKAVFETQANANSSHLDISTIVREAKKQVRHVAYSLLPNEAYEKQTRLLSSKRSARSSDVSSIFDASPFSRSELIPTPDTSVVGTPSSIGAVLGYEHKRYRPMPPLPNAPSTYINENSITYE